MRPPPVSPSARAAARPVTSSNTRSSASSAAATSALAAATARARLEAVEPGRVRRGSSALGERTHRQRRCRQRLHRPRLEVHDALAVERARAHARRVPERAPGERPEEPDRVVLRAVALPVAGDDVGPAAPARRAPVPPAASLSTALASDSRLCHATASRNAGSRATAASRASSSGPNTSSPSTGKPALRTAKSRPQAPLRESSVRYSLECHSSQCRRPSNASTTPARGAPARPQTRDRICAAAEELFLRDGYARTSIRAVARGGGRRRGDGLSRLRDKAALLDAVIVRATRDNASEPPTRSPAGRARSSRGSRPPTPR